MATSPQNMLHKMIRAATILHSLFCAMLLQSIRAVAALVMVCGSGYALDIPGTHLSAYTISGVRVDATDETAAAAREAALSQGRQQAFRLLAARLGVSSDSIPEVDVEALSRLVLGVTIQQEGLASIRYTGKVAVTFFPEAVRTLFAESNVHIFDTLAPTQVILPIWTSSPQKGPALWSDENPWRLAWTDRLKTGLVPVEVPLGDLQDVGAVRSTQAFSLDREVLLNLAHRYHADDVVVTHAQLLRSDGGDPRAIRVTAARRKDGGFLFNKTLPLMEGLQKGDYLKETLSYATEHVVAWLDALWREDYALSPPGYRDTTLALRIDIPAGLQDWVSIRRALDGMRYIQSWRLVSLHLKEAWISATVRGSPEQLIPEIAAAGLYIDKGDEYWVVRPGVSSE